MGATHNIGPASAPTDGHLAVWDGTTGKLLKDGGAAPSGTNTGDVTLAGTPNYLTIAAQVITRALINLASHVTGRLPFANLTAATTSSILLGRRSASSGDFEEIALGSNLSMSGTTLNASAGAGSGTPGGSPGDWQKNDGVGGFAGFTPASGVETFVTTPSSANLRAALTDESGTGAAYFQGGDIGTPSAGVLTSCTGLPLATGAYVTPQGRLTLTSATPWLSSAVTGATTVYYTPAHGNVVPIYDGTNWSPKIFTELSQATTDASKSPAACGNNSNYDLFVWNDSGTLRCTRGPAWTSDTSRGTGAGTTELEFIGGVLMNKIAITNGPAADRGTYVGTIRTNGSAAVDMIFGGSGGAGGEGTILGIWNMYNRRFCALQNFDTTDSWNYTLATFRLKNAGASTELNKIKFVIGWQGDGIHAINTATYNNTSSSIIGRIGIGLNSTTAIAAGASIGMGRSFSATGRLGVPPSVYAGPAPLGFNYVAPLEFSNATGAATWYGDDGAATDGTNDRSNFSMTTMF